MSGLAEYKRITHWKREGQDFRVEVAHWTRKPYDTTEYGENHWNVYVYFYPNHPYFCSFDGNDMFQDAAIDVPLHGGVSLLQNITVNGSPTSVCVGCDYGHLHDDHFSRISKPAEAAEVFRDADQLYEWCADRARSEVPNAD